MKTGNAVPDEEASQIEMDFDATEEVVAEERDRAILIKLAPDGKVSFNLDGSFQVHEVFGALYTTIVDLTVQQFIHPGLKQVIQGGKNSEANIVGSIQNLSDQIAASSDNDAVRDPKAEGLVAGLAELLKSFEKTDS